MKRLVALLSLFALLIGCADRAPRGGGDILVLGDSVMAWNGDQSIGDRLGVELGRPVVNRAVPGAEFDNDSGLLGAVGFDVQRQFPGGQWNWIVLNGGANDLSDDCGCGACSGTVAQLIGPDGQSGLIPDFIARLRAESGAQVLWMGYYKGNGRGSFEGCRGDLVEIERRIAAYAEGRPGVHFVDSEAVIEPSNPGHFAPDNNHPSTLGSALIGAYLADVIRARSQGGRKPL
ncbi:MAG: SGNH/GDSL hydrolase family protein [Sulfitobacter sp.]|nr:SGNH/GDSL hydrolase family protein [Sulfitobacter sp.]